MYDAIVVGARCAGAPTAMLLARKGYRVLLVDRAAFPSDMSMSTHLIWQSGAERLRRWGLLDRVLASDCPPLTSMHLDLGAFALDGVPTPADGVTEACGPRRTVLDKILVDAAVEAGAELREGFSVGEVVTDDGRVTGIRGGTRDGSTATESARIVIGADGTNSTVARCVAAPEYNARPPLQGTYFTYWSGVPMDAVVFHPRQGRAVYGWYTNDGLTLVGVNWTAKDFPAVRGDIEGNYLQVLEQCAPELAVRVRGGKREDRWIGGAIRNFFRKPHGPGWALVGDAGWTVDPCTAAGINAAFRDVELLVEAVDDGLSDRRPLDEALAEYGQRRDDVGMPIYEFACQLAPLDPFPAELQQLFEALRNNQEGTNRLFGLFAQTVSVPEFFAPKNIQHIVSRPVREDEV